MTRVIVEITEIVGSHTKFKVSEESDNRSSDADKKWSKVLSGAMMGFFERIRKASLNGEIAK